MLPPLVYVWPYALVFWGVFFWAFAPEFRIVARDDKPPAIGQDANSKRLIAIGQGFAMLAAFAAASTVRSATMSHRAWLLWIGVVTMVGGSLLRRHCWRMLGTSFTGTVIVKPGQAVVERGAYRYVRHPSYSAGAILFLGIGLALGNWVSVVVLMVGVSTVYGYRVHVEERALVAVIGEPYRRYMNRTKRFVPLLF